MDTEFALSLSAQVYSNLESRFIQDPSNFSLDEVILYTNLNQDRDTSIAILLIWCFSQSSPYQVTTPCVWPFRFTIDQIYNFILRLVFVYYICQHTTPAPSSGQHI